MATIAEYGGNLASALAGVPAGETLYIPAGTYTHTGKITRRAPITIIGDGKGATRLAFSGLNSGIELDLSGGVSNYQPVNISNLTMLTRTANAGTALRLIYPYTEGIEGSNSAFPSAHLENLAFLPEPGVGSAYWTGGVQLVNARHAKLIQLYYKGRGGSPPPTGTFGIRLTNAATDASIWGPQVYNTHRAIYCDQDTALPGGGAGHMAEGIHIVHPNLVEVIRGIEMSTPYREAGLYVSKGHISAHEFCILMERRFHATIEGLLFFKDDGSTMDWVGVRGRLADSYHNNIYGNHFRVQPGAGGSARGIVLSETEGAIVTANNFWFPEGNFTGTAVTLMPTTKGCLVTGNRRTRGGRTVLDQGKANRVAGNLPA